MTALRFEKDKTGFPLVWVEAIQAYMHWVPVTKLQFEYYMCAAPDSRFGGDWYDEVLERNPRVSPGGIRVNNYWRAILTNILPNEAQRFARWCGEGYSLPTLEEWFKAYQSLKEIPPEDPSAFDAMEINLDRIRTTIVQLDAKSRTALQQGAGYDRTLADQMLMRWGVMEWVECPNSRYRWGSMGEISQRLHPILFTPDLGQPATPSDSESTRLHYYGFRLLWRQE